MANTQTAPALEDGQWYWVRYDIGFGADAIEAPARYQAHVDCFYSHQFSGIPARECEVLGPALRSPPADLTFDALLKRIKASPFRDDMALASLLVSQAEEIKALRQAASRVYQVRMFDSADVPLEEMWPAEFEALGRALQAGGPAL